jgi:uncharacterized damage-inducible protein DinB
MLASCNALTSGGSFMRRFVCMLFVLLLFSPKLMRAQDKPAGPTTLAAVPTSGARAEFLEEIAYYEQRFTQLAGAIPADKYTWRPAEGVRSIGEVYMHVVAANYGIAKALGTPIPAGIDPKALIASAGDKAKVVQGLTDSFAHFRSAIVTIKDSDLDNAQKMFNRQTTVRGAFIMIAGHLGEHLGQSIAYARQIGVVPPWTEERQKQEAAEKPKP